MRVGAQIARLKSGEFRMKKAREVASTVLLASICAVLCWQTGTASAQQPARDVKAVHAEMQAKINQVTSRVGAAQMAECARLITSASNFSGSHPEIVGKFVLHRRASCEGSRSTSRSVAIFVAQTKILAWGSTKEIPHACEITLKDGTVTVRFYGSTWYPVTFSPCNSF